MTLLVLPSVGLPDGFPIIVLFFYCLSLETDRDANCHEFHEIALPHRNELVSLSNKLVLVL